MKSIEEIVCEKHSADLKKPKHKRIGETCFIDWAQFGAREAQRWISIGEELPNNKNTILVKDGSEISPVRCCALFDDGVFHPDFVLTHEDVKFWRPIERK